MQDSNKAVTNMGDLSGAEIIVEERQRQIQVEGYTNYEDEQRYETGNEDLAIAGACYAFPAEYRNPDSAFMGIPQQWPWDDTYWKPTPGNRVRELAKAGALIAAQIDLINKHTAASAPPPVSGEKVYRWVKGKPTIKGDYLVEDDEGLFRKMIYDATDEMIVKHWDNHIISFEEEVSLPVMADEWISIKDQSPEEIISFIAFTGGLILLLGRHGDKYYTSEGILWVNEVDFWMAKPKPPIPTKTTFIR